METALAAGQQQECVGYSPAFAGQYERSWDNEMSEMTIIQLLVAQRERELRAQRRPGWWDRFELPCVWVLGVCLLLLAIVAAVVAVVLSPFRRPPVSPITDQAAGQE